MRVEQTSVDETSDSRQETSSPSRLWKAIEGNEEAEWYSLAVKYWDKQEASYNGVLGGFGYISEADLLESKKFLLRVFKSQLEEAESGKRRLVAVDCGAGVGRVTEQLLIHHFQEVDLVEPSQHLLSKAKERLQAADLSKPLNHNMKHSFCLGLQNFIPERFRYDVIWIQWALLYVTDDDAVAFLLRATEGLKEDGIIIVKENICDAETAFVVDEEDKSLTRSNAYMQKLFTKAKLKLILSAQQKHFPRDLFKVQMYALCASKRN